MLQSFLRSCAWEAYGKVEPCFLKGYFWFEFIFRPARHWETKPVFQLCGAPCKIRRKIYTLPPFLLLKTATYSIPRPIAATYFSFCSMTRSTQTLTTHCLEYAFETTQGSMRWSSNTTELENFFSDYQHKSRNKIHLRCIISLKIQIYFQK